VVGLCAALPCALACLRLYHVALAHPPSYPPSQPPPQREDLPLLCERHATSKLRAFEDLEAVASLGFRGEALASISYVARVTVTTMTAADEAAGHGWRASFEDGALLPPGAKPAAATRGTTVLADDMFYNAPLRRRALRPAAEELAAVLDAVGRYAVFHAGAALSVRRAGAARPELATQRGGSRRDAVRAVYGDAVARALLPLTLRRGGFRAPGDAIDAADADAAAAAPAASDDDDSLRCAINGFVTGAEYASSRAARLVLFINGRSVDCAPLRRALEAAWAELLPNRPRPFAFLDVRLPPAHVDVNVHPTKREVAFLHQEALVEAVVGAARGALAASNAARTFALTQTTLPGAGAVAPPPALAAAGGKPAYRPERLVRTDARAQTLRAFFPAEGGGGAATQAAAAAEEEGEPEEEGGEEGDAEMEEADAEAGPRGAARGAAAAAPPARPRAAAAAAGDGAAGDGAFAFMPTAMEIGGAATQAAATQRGGVRRPVRQRPNPAAAVGGLASVARLLAAAEAAPHAGLAELLAAPTFVGLADATRALLQAGTRLYLLDLSTLTYDLFYQQALRRFGRAPRLALAPPVDVAALARAALDAEAAAGRWDDAAEGGARGEVAALLAALVRKKAPLLRECFGVEVDAGGRLAALPALVEGHAPAAAALPAFVLALGRRVEWGEEEACFRTLAEALAELYAARAAPGEEAAAAEDEAAERAADAGGGAAAADVTAAAARAERRAARDAALRAREWAAEHVLLPALRAFLAPPPGRATDGSVVELARLESLYRVFERC
jgi:DNA mismatch repair protein MLH1